MVETLSSRRLSQARTEMEEASGVIDQLSREELALGQRKFTAQQRLEKAQREFLAANKAFRADERVDPGPIKLVKMAREGDNVMIQVAGELPSWGGCYVYVQDRKTGGWTRAWHQQGPGMFALKIPLGDRTRVKLVSFNIHGAELVPLKEAPEYATPTTPEGGGMTVIGTIQSAIWAKLYPRVEKKIEDAITTHIESEDKSAPPPALVGPGYMLEMVLDASAEEHALASGEKLDWRNSIVDLMKLVTMNPSVANRKALADEFGYSGTFTGTDKDNIWLHAQFMAWLRSSSSSPVARPRRRASK